MDVGAVRSRRRRGAMSQPSPTQAANDRAARAQEEITRRTALGEFGQPPNLALRDRAMKEIFEQELSRLSRVIRCGDRVFSGSTLSALSVSARGPRLPQQSDRGSAVRALSAFFRRHRRDV